MDLITPFDLVSKFPEGQSIVIVGNAPTLHESRLGAWIDSHDVIVRFNDCRVVGHEEDVGSRTDILVSNPYAETRPDRRVGDAVSPRVVVVINPMTRRGEKKDFENWVGDFPVLFTYSPDIRLDLGDRRKLSLTTGTYGLIFITNVLQPSQISVTGFTMFKPGSDHHYWSSEVPSGIKAHKPATEAGVFSDVLNALKCPVIITQEILGVFETARKRPGRRVKTLGTKGPLSWLRRKGH